MGSEPALNKRKQHHAKAGGSRSCATEAGRTNGVQLKKRCTDTDNAAGSRVSNGSRSLTCVLAKARLPHLRLDQKGWIWWREARFGPWWTTRGCGQCGASETRRIATGGLAEQAGRLRFATSAARREHGKDARRRGASHVVARRSQATRIADDGRGRRRTALRGRGVRREGVAASAVENARLASIGAGYPPKNAQRFEGRGRSPSGKPTETRFWNKTAVS